MRTTSRDVRFAFAPDSTRLAYAIHGHGSPIVRVATWLTHLELDWESPIWRHWVDRLGDHHTLLRYDERGCGLSDADPGEPTVETWVNDLEAVVDAAGIDRFALLGISQGAAVGAAYAARHPERVTGLILYGGYARGRRLRDQGAEEAALVAAARAGWAAADPTFRHVFSMLFLPTGTEEQMAWYDELIRRTTTAEAAVRLIEARGAVDIVAVAPHVKARTLVVHARGDRVVPVEEGCLLAALIPGSRLLLVDSANHILLAHEPAWEQFLDAVDDFLGVPPGPTRPAAVLELSPRELEVLELVAAGMTNDAIADRLFVSVRTVERHLSNIYGKLNVSGKSARAAAAAAFALRAGRHDASSQMGSGTDAARSSGA